MASGGAGGPQPPQQQPRLARSHQQPAEAEEPLLSLAFTELHHANPAPSVLLSPTPRSSCGCNGGGSPSLFLDGADGPGSGSRPPFGGSGAGTCNSSADVAQVFGGGANSLFLEKTPFVEGLSYNLNTMQHPSQPFQPVVLAN